MKLPTAVLIAAVVAFAAACASYSPEPAPDLELATALAELEQLPTPAGANPQHFAELKSALAASLRASGRTKFASQAPQGPSGAVTDLELRNTGGGVELQWTYRNKGDFDQNSNVNISDLSALGANLGKTAASPDWLSKAIAADGDDNGEVNISDITPLGANLNHTVSGYWVQSTMTPENEGSWENEVQLPFKDFAAPDGEARKVRKFNLIDALPLRWYRVTPYDDSDSTLGEPSNAVQYALSAPVITSVTPTSGLAGIAVSFGVARTGGTPASWSWDFGGGATPDTSTQPAPSVTLGAAGSYNASVTLSNAAGSDTFDFTLEVANPAPPQVDEVQPLGGTEGAQVSFGATLSGGPVATYAWDFGSGATPNTEDAAAPFVTLGAAGPYLASLTVTNAGGSDTFNFTLTVTPAFNNPPTASFSVTPQDGPPGTPVQLDASASTDSDGTIAQYEWDLDGDGSFELDGGTDPLAVTTLPDGSVDVSLQVTDNGGATAAATRTLTGESTPPEWQISSVHATSNGLGFPYLAEVNGLPVVAFPETNFGGQQFLAFAYTDTDDASNGWNQLQVNGDSPAALSVAQVNGTPAIAYIVESDSSLKYAYTGTADGSGDWHDALVAAAETYGGKVSLAAVNGKPSIGYFSKTSSAVLFAHSSEDDGSGNWSTVTVDGSDAIGASLAVVNGKPALAYTTAADPPQRQLRFAYSSLADGSGGWTSLTVAGSDGCDWSRQTLRVVGGLPAVLYGSSETKEFRFAHSTQLDGSGGWSVLDTGMGGNTLYYYPQSLAFAQYPCSALITTSDEVSVGVNSQPDGTGSWSEEVVEAGADGVTIATVNGHPAVAYKMLGFPEVRYAIYK